VEVRDEELENRKLDQITEQYKEVSELAEKMVKTAGLEETT
jgi:hypothetical protein